MKESGYWKRLTKFATFNRGFLIKWEKEKENTVELCYLYFATISCMLLCRITTYEFTREIKTYQIFGAMWSLFFCWFTQYLSEWVYKPPFKHKGCVRVSNNCFNDWFSDLQTDWLNQAGKSSKNTFPGMVLPAPSSLLPYCSPDWLTNIQTVCGSWVEPLCIYYSFIFNKEKLSL